VGWRERLREGWRDFVDRFAILEQLWAVAATTAILTVGLTVGLEAFGLAIDDPWQPAQGFVIAALVSFAGHRLAAGGQRARLATVASAAARALDTPLSRFAYTLPEAKTVSVRALARAESAGRLDDELNLWAESILADALDDLCVEFERETVRHVERLSPPRANTLVDRIVRGLRDAALAMHRMAETGTDFGGRGLLDFRLQLSRVRSAAEELEGLRDRGAFRIAEAERDRVDAAAHRTRRELQDRVRDAARQILVSLAPSPEALARSSASRGDVTLRELGALERFAFAPEHEAADVGAWRAQTGPTQRAFLAAIEGRGLEMHPRTHRAWIAANDAVRELDNALGDLHSGLSSEPLPTPGSLEANVYRRVEERRVAILAKVRALVARVDEASTLEIN
jgi:hypothetical protein